MSLIALVHLTSNEIEERHDSYDIQTIGHEKQKSLQT